MACQGGQHRMHALQTKRERKCVFDGVSTHLDTIRCSPFPLSLRYQPTAPQPNTDERNAPPTSSAWGSWFGSTWAMAARSSSLSPGEPTAFRPSERPSESILIQ